MRFPFPGLVWLALFACCMVLIAQAIASPQTTAPAARPIGVVVAVDTAARRIVLKTDAGPEMGIEIQESTRVLRVAPGSQDLSRASRIALADLSAGDRILVRGHGAPSGNSFVADLVVVMSRSDLAEKQEAERADWEKRGIGGVITSLDQASREVTIRVGGLKSSKYVVLQAPSEAKLRRYAHDSIRFSDARPSLWEQLKIGDQVKARGESSNDGERFLVEELVSGSFRDFAATLTAVDAERGVLKMLDLGDKNRIEARVLPTSLVRRLTPEVVQLLSERISEVGQESKKTSSGRNLLSIIEASPSLAITDLKPGDVVVISASYADDPTKLTAIAVLTGAEPLLRRPSQGAREPDIGSWNLDLNMGVGAP